MNTSVPKNKSALHRQLKKYATERREGIPLEIFLWVTVFSVCGYLLTHPSLPSEAVKKSLSFCLKTLIPSLFPFMIAGELLIASGFPSVCEKYLGKIFSRVFGINGKGAAAFVIGAFCGFPVGSKTAVSLYLSGDITKKDAEKLSGVSNNCGLGFLISGIGAGIWGSTAFGVSLYVVQLFSAALTSFFLFGIHQKGKHESVSVNADESTPKKNFSFSEALSSAISSSALSMLRVIGFVVFFEVALSLVSSALSSAGAGQFIISVISAFTEITSGAISLNLMSALPSFTYLYAAKILTFTLSAWGGLSVYMQFCTFAYPSGVGTKAYLKSKLTQSVLSTLIGSILVLLKIV